MNLLVFSPWFPCPPDNGSRLRAFHLLRELSRQGHTIRLVTGLQDDIAPNADREALAAFCESVQVFPWQWHRGDSSGLVQTVSSLLSPVPRSITETENPPLRDAIRQEFARKPDACLAMQLAAAPFLPAETEGVPILLEEVEITGVTRAVSEASSAKSKLQATLTKTKHDNYWRRELRRFQALTVVSEEEAVAVRGLLGENAPPVSVVPNGVECTYYPPRTEKPVPGRMIYNGALTYGPNRDAVAWFLRDILPAIVAKVPEAHLVVTGRYDAEAERLYAGEQRIRLTGFLPDLRPTLAEATVCAVPLRTGGGTRLKILEAWAAGIPVVSTGIGAVGLAGSRNETHFLQADTAATFAEACVRLLTEPNTASEIATHARRLAEERYDWSALTGQIITVLENLINR